MTTQQSEYNKECSLTSPEDRDRENRWKPDQSSLTLTENQVTDAMSELNVTSFVDKFPRVDRTYADPGIPLQLIGLVSFIPAKGATPNKDGVFGMAKLRGNYGTPLEADQRAEYLIRNADSYHKIFHTYVGRPFPITFSSQYSAETSEIDIRKQTTEAISSSIKEKKASERQTVRDIEDRAADLVAESKQEEADPYENYITLRVKKAQLSWTYLEHQKKMVEVKEIIIRTRKEIEDIDTEHEEFKDNYYEKYMEARDKAGIKETKEDSQANFIKYMVEDADLGF